MDRVLPDLVHCRDFLRADKRVTRLYIGPVERHKGGVRSRRIAPILSGVQCIAETRFDIQSMLAYTREPDAVAVDLHDYLARISSR